MKRRSWPIAALAQRHSDVSFGKSFGSGSYAADNLIGSTIDGSSFSGLFTRVEIGHIRIGLPVLKTLPLSNRLLYARLHRERASG